MFTNECLVYTNGGHTSKSIRGLILGFCAYIYWDNFNKHQNNTTGIHRDIGEEVKRMKNIYLEEFKLGKPTFPWLITLIQQSEFQDSQDCTEKTCLEKKKKKKKRDMYVLQIQIKAWISFLGSWFEELFS
jgi:hypothetical protein